MSLAINVTLSGTDSGDFGIINSISHSGWSSEIKEKSSLSLPTNAKEFYRGMRDAGEVSLNCDMETAIYTKLVAQIKDDAADSFDLSINDMGSLSFDGFVSDFNAVTDDGETITIDCTIKITGDITYSAT